MAPSSSRRSSYSRKAQYGVFTGYVVATIGALIGAVLLGLSLWQPSSFEGTRGAAQNVVAPVGEATAIARTESQSWFESIAGFYRAGSQNARLKREMELARIKLAEARATDQENTRLKALLDLSEDEVEPVAIARLIGSTASSTRRFAYLGVGRNDGIEVGMPVRSPRGVVGRILETSSGTSRVLLLTDSQSVLPVRLAGEEVVAFVEGRGDGMVQIRLVNLGINPLKPGDVLVTSGSGGYYRPNIAVAVVAEKTDDGAIGRVVSDPAATDFVSVEPIWQPDTVRGTEQAVDEMLAE